MERGREAKWAFGPVVYVLFSICIDVIARGFVVYIFFLFAGEVGCTVCLLSARLDGIISFE